MREEMLQIYTNGAAFLSGIIFWAGFMVFGFIARRYNMVFNKSTFHGLLMVAPSGILIYSVLMVIKFSAVIKDPAVNNVLQWAAYIFLFLSAALCLFAIIKFSRLLDSLLKYEGTK
jgi:hypothetical protein